MGEYKKVPKSMDEMISANESNSRVTWNKLDKTVKLKKMNDYVNEYQEENHLTDEQANELKFILKDKINHKQLQKTKDVIYDSEQGIIKNIPMLAYNPETKQFIFRMERASPLNSLTPKNKTVRKI